MIEFEKDPAALALARRLAAADFSGDSRVRYGLLARLLSRPPSRVWPARVLVAWAIAGLVLFIPIHSALRREPRFPLGENGLPVLPGNLPETVGGRADIIFEARPADRIIESSPAQSIARDGAIAMVWRVGAGSYVLERRPTSLDELFVRRMP